MQLFNISQGSYVMQMQVIYYSEWTGSVRDHFAPCLSVICCSSMMRTRELLSVFVLLLLFLTIQIILQYYLFRVWHSQCCQRQRIICTQSCFGINNKTSKESKTTWSPRIFFVSWDRWLPLAGVVKASYEGTAMAPFSIEVNCPVFTIGLWRLKCHTVLTWVQWLHPC